jgi:hypothetical protein
MDICGQHGVRRTNYKKHLAEAFEAMKTELADQNIEKLSELPLAKHPNPTPDGISNARPNFYLQ